MLKIERGISTPEVILDNNQEVYSLTGRSFPEDTRSFFEPIFNWFENEPLPNKMTIRCKFDYLSSSTVIAFIELVRLIEKKKEEQGSDVTIEWNYEQDDTDVLEIGKDIEELSGLNYIFIEV